jgi:SRSO17 transposase
MPTPLDQAPSAEPLIAGLDELHARIARRFARAEARSRARRYLAGLLSPIERKNGWQLAEYLEEPGPQGVQRLLNAADWDADAVRDDLRAYVVAHLGDASGVLLVDETGFLKKGTKSAGVARQYSGTAGRRENQQVGVFLAYASARGCAFLDRALYLPEVWAEDAERRAEAGIPSSVEFATKGELARTMLERAFGADVPARWVAGDTVYGHDELRRWLEGQGRGYVLAVPCTHLIWTAGRQEEVQTLAAHLAEDAWARLSAGAGSQGPRWYDWACVRLPYEACLGMAHWLLIRRDLTDPTELAYYRVYGPEETSVPEMVRVAGMRWAIEGALEQAKGEVGLDQYEVRRWEAWYRHITLALLAHAFLEVTRIRSTAATTGKGEAPPSASPSPCPRSAGCSG